MAIKALIVDDEPIAQDILETYLGRIPGVALAGKCRNALEAFRVLSNEQVDILLLDINMPEITGIDFLKTLKDPPKVIFTTAYSEYAIESYELYAIDYLLKPISFERFLKAINKAVDAIHKRTDTDISMKNADSSTIDNLLFVKTEGKLVRIDLTRLWFVEGLKDYVRLWTDQGKTVVHSTMKNMEESLAQYPNFIRIHKSHIVNMDFITEIDGNSIRIKDQLLVIGNTYRDEINKLFERYRLL
jgi:DNA-binding LytR/AlgR family response regulator